MASTFGRSKSFFRKFSTVHHLKIDPPTSSYDLASKLIEDAIFKGEGILAINKPYGISFARNSKWNKENKIRGDYEVSLETMLPCMEELVGHPLISVKAPEKYISGVSIFCANETYAKNVKKKLTIMRDCGEFADTYLSVLIGKPKRIEDHFDGAITLEGQKDTKEKMLKFIREWSNNSLKKRIVKRVSLFHKILRSSSCASLVQIQSTRNKWHCVRAYLSTMQLSPVLGDNIYGSMVSHLLGTPILLDRLNPAANAPQKLPEEVLNLLNLKSRSDISVPVHLHLSELCIKDFKKGQNLILKAPLPDFFKWTCEKLVLKDRDKPSALKSSMI